MNESLWRKRKDVFVREGLEEGKARDLAAQMMLRDYEDGLDDRRVCFECRNYKNKVCMAYTVGKGKYKTQMAPLRFILQRCDRFHLRGAV